MSAATDNVINALSGEGAGLSFKDIAQEWNGPIAANVHIYQGSLAGVLNSDTSTNYPGLLPFVAGGTMSVRGFAVAEYNNTGGAKGAIPCRVRAQVGQMVDLNAGGGSAITIADLWKPIYAADDATCSKLKSDGDLVGILTGIDPTSGNPMVLVSPVVVKLLTVLASSGVTFTQTYSTAATTVPADTSHALTDSSGGTPSTTAIAAITQAGNAGSADVGPVKDNFATVAAELALIKADALATKKLVNKLIDVLQAVGLVG